MPDKLINQSCSRRRFLQRLGLGATGVVVLGSYGFNIHREPVTGKIKVIAIDFEKCAGCRTCESVCSSFNHQTLVNGKKLNGLGNPSLSNIRVFHYNPDIDIPSTCALCDDAPCVEVCPVEPDPVTGRKALYRDTELMTITNDLGRCIGCQSCALECSKRRAGVIKPDPDTGSPMRMCTLCGGNPKCVEYCPYDALAYIELDDDRDLSNLAPEKIAEKMIKKLYNPNQEVN
ncbi:MAG TPA: 4Fe-4S dicluster domain-containing protein [Bacteroidales bacterium]|nr:4Fe-4S dicluster domain-containing protein [Bacteroidales bacterium]